MKLRGNLSKDQFDDDNLAGGLITKRLTQATDRDWDEHHSPLEYRAITHFLMANVGRPWDLVFSEALHKFHDPAGELRQHLRWTVNTNVYEDRQDRIVRPMTSYRIRDESGRHAPVSGFYVHPRTGILQHNDEVYRTPQDRLAGRIYAFLTTIKLLDYTMEYFSDRWFIETPRPGQPIEPNAVRIGEMVSVWECRNGVWLIHAYERMNPMDIAYTRMGVAEDGTKTVTNVYRYENKYCYPDWKRISTRSADRKGILRMQADRKTRQKLAA